MQKLYFDKEAAEKVGLVGAVLLNYIAYWCDRNRLNSDHLKDGKTWMYMTFAEWGEKLPFLSKNTIQRTIYSLQQKGYIEIKHHGKGLLRTNWYTLTEDGWQLADFRETAKNQPLPQNGEIISPERGNVLPQNGEMHFPKSEFPTIYTKIDNTDITQRAAARAYAKEYDDAINLFVNNMRPAASKRDLDRLVSLVDDYGNDKVIDALEESIANDAVSLNYTVAILERKAKKKEGGSNGRSTTGYRQSVQKHETEGIRKLKEDMRRADERQVYPWDVQSPDEGTGRSS